MEGGYALPPNPVSEEIEEIDVNELLDANWQTGWELDGNQGARGPYIGTKKSRRPKNQPISHVVKPSSCSSILAGF